MLFHIVGGNPMKKIKNVIGVALCAFLLTGCSLSDLFGGNSENENGDNNTTQSQDEREVMKFNGHYLVDIGTKTAESRVQIFKNYKESATLKDNEFYDNIRLMGGEYYGKGFRFGPSSSSSKDAYITYTIEPGQYKTLCFALGTLDKSANSDSALMDTASLQVFIDGECADEILRQAMDPVSWHSFDIDGATTIKFLVGYRFQCDAMAAMEVSLWEDANHRIDESKPKAQGEENLDEVCPIIHSSAYLEDWHLAPGELNLTINNKTYDSGFLFSPGSGVDAENVFEGTRATYNTFGRYKYIHFFLGHCDLSSRTGGIYLNILTGNKIIKQIKFDQTMAPIEVSVDINYAHYVTFACCADFDSAHSEIGRVSYYGVVNIIGSPFDKPSVSDATPTFEGSYKALSQVGRPYNFVTNFNTKDAEFLGTTKYAGIQIGGVIYTEGLLMKSIFNIMTSTVEQIPASADFNLYNQFKYMTFKVGRRDRTASVNEVMNIYLDNNLVKTLTLNSVGTILDVTVDLNFASTVRLELVGSANTYRGQYGVVDIGLHTDEIRPLNFVHTPQTNKAALDEYPANTTVQLMEDIRCYDSFSGANEQTVLTDDRSDTAEYVRYGGRTFNAGGEDREIGFVLQTGRYTGYGFGDGPSIAILICCEPLLVALGSQTVNCSSYAAFAVREKFNTLEFDACSLEGSDSGKIKTLKILGDMEVIDEITLTSGVESHIKSDITGVTNLVFLLEYGEENVSDSDIMFGFYNLKVSNFYY